MTHLNSHTLPRCRNEQKWSLVDHVGMPIVELLIGEHLPTTRMLLGSVPGAWPTLHGQSQVQHPGRNSLPGQKVVVGTRFRQISVCIMASPPFLFLFEAFCQILRLLHGMDISTT